MAANQKNQKAVDRILHPVAGGKVGIRDLMEDEGQRSFIQFGTYDYITKYALAGYNPALPVVDATITTTDPDIYTLTAPELALLNQYGRYPNFVAIVLSSGTQFTDIQPSYIGSPGSFTAVTVQLHSDGSGNNADNTYIQFS